MAILNMTYWSWWWGWPVVPLNAISNLSAEAWRTTATLKWTDPWNLTVNGVLLTSWNSTKLVRKIGSAPSTSSDGTLVVTETVADTYSSTGYQDTGLTWWTTYYYKAFAVWDNWTESASNIVTAVPWREPWTDTLFYVKWDGNVTDYWPNNISFSWSMTYWTDWNLTYMVANSSNRIQTTAYNASVPFTFSYWIWVNTSPHNGYPRIFNANSSSTSELEFNINYESSSTFAAYCNWWDYPSYSWLSYWTRHNITVTVTSGGVAKVYADWVLGWTGNIWTVCWTWFTLCRNGNTGGDYFTWRLSKLLWETKVWSDTDVLNRYNQTKWEYWIN